jgi:hypothetical protein
MSMPTAALAGAGASWCAGVGFCVILFAGVGSFLADLSVSFDGAFGAAYGPADLSD